MLNTASRAHDELIPELYSQRQTTRELAASRHISNNDEYSDALEESKLILNKDAMHSRQQIRTISVPLNQDQIGQSDKLMNNKSSENP